MELERIAERLCDLLERDSTAGERLAEAQALPEGPERSRAAAQAALASAETPLEIMEACLGALRILLAGVRAGIPERSTGDCVSAATSLRAALEGGYLSVPEHAGDDRRAAARAMRREADELLAAVRGAAEKVGR